MKKSKPKSAKKVAPAAPKGVGGFSIKGRAPKRNSAPKSFAGRRAASHAKAYPS